MECLDSQNVQCNLKIVQIPRLYTLPYLIMQMLCNFWQLLQHTIFHWLDVFFHMGESRKLGAHSHLTRVFS